MSPKTQVSTYRQVLTVARSVRAVQGFSQTVVLRDPCQCLPNRSRSLYRPLPLLVRRPPLPMPGTLSAALWNSSHSLVAVTQRAGHWGRAGCTHAPNAHFLLFQLGQIPAAIGYSLVLCVIFVAILCALWFTVGYTDIKYTAYSAVMLPAAAANATNPECVCALRCSGCHVWERRVARKSVAEDLHDWAHGASCCREGGGERPGMCAAAQSLIGRPVAGRPPGTALRAPPVTHQRTQWPVSLCLLFLLTR